MKCRQMVMSLMEVEEFMHIAELEWQKIAEEACKKGEEIAKFEATRAKICEKELHQCNREARNACDE